MSNAERNPDNFALSVKEGLEGNDVSSLKDLYKSLSEEENIEHAKTVCTSMYHCTLECILDKIKSKEANTMTKYYAWHFLQLGTSSSDIVEKVQKDFQLLPALMNLHTEDFDDDLLDSLHAISLTFLVVMLGVADDLYYDHFAECGALSFVHNMLAQTSLSSTDSQIESLILLLNLVLEGTSACKNQLINLDFEKLLAKKIKERQQCNENLLKVSQVTHQKLLLLTSEHQTFIETFRHGFQEVAKKQKIYQEVKTCSFGTCEVAYNSQFKRCSRCKTTTYCSKECQVKHWKNGHSKTCVPVT